MLKVTKFGGSSMADAGQYRKIKDIIAADRGRRVVVVSAAGKRNREDHKITDLLYLCYAHTQYGVDCDRIFEMITSRYIEIRDELGLKVDLETEFAELKKRLDAKAFSENPYMAILEGLPKRSGNCVLMPMLYRRGEILCYDAPDFSEELVVPKLGFFSTNVMFPTLYENELPWMSICPSEIHSMQREIDAAHGKVLVLGLGLGYYAWAVAQNPLVESVTVIELSQNVIDLFETHIAPKLDFKDKLSLIRSDAIAYLATLTGGEYDFCFADIWEGAVDGAKWYKKILPHENRLKETAFTYWIEDAIREYLKMP